MMALPFWFGRDCPLSVVQQAYSQVKNPLAKIVHPVYGAAPSRESMMKLHAWMTQNKLDDADVAEIAGISRVSINRLRRGVHLPSWDTMNRLAAATDNEVMPNDFLESAYQKS
jgi:DNA-binding XRE family transcriptional regulator